MSPLNSTKIIPPKVKSAVHREDDTLYLSRLLCGLIRADKREVIHVNGDSLDYQRDNLAIVHRSTAMQNRPKRRLNRLGTAVTSQYVGVSWNKRSKKWYAGLRVAGKIFCIGSFQNELDSAYAYDKAAREVGGVGIRLNFPA